MSTIIIFIVVLSIAAGVAFGLRAFGRTLEAMSERDE